MRIEAIELKTSLPPIKTQTKCTKMTDESDSIIKNGINGAVAGCGVGGGGGTAIHVSRGSAISSSGGGGVSATITVGSGSTNLRMQYSSSGGGGGGGSSFVGNDQSNNQETSAGALTGSGGGSGNNAADAIRSPNPGIGGRLQFFKDGKFILELARAREGERTGWVSVPRKTFWPPSASSAATTNSNYPKNESSTSLSFSDDNSSIQSSPWQRDHCWKQATPRRSVSKEMCMFFKRTKKFSLSHDGYKTAQLKRRRPHDNSICKIPFTLVKNGFIKTEYVEAGDIKKETGEDGVNEKTTVEGAPTIKIEEIKRNEKRKPKCRAKLSTILEKLIDRPTGLFYLSKGNPPSGIINHFSTTPSRITDLHNHQQHVSPRKRILRELEKVSLEDNSTKRSRAKNNVTAISPLIPTSPSTTVSQAQSVAATSQRITFQNNGNTQVSNGNGNVTTNDSNAISGPNSNRLYSSYSIHSLLGNSNSNSNKNESNNIQNSKDVQDPSCLRIMLTSPNSSENYYGSRNSYSSGSGKRRSPNYCMPQDSHNHNRRSSRESPNNYGSNHPSESSLSPDPINRYKPSSNTAVATSFHPYLSSPKYSPSTVSPNTLNDNYKQKSGYVSGSPNHQQMTSKLSSTSRSSTASSYSQQSPHSSKTSSVSSNSRLREQSPGENLSPSSTDRRDGTPRTVPKKTVAFRQQFSSPTSSLSVVPSDSLSIYKSPSEQKRKNIEERTLSPENKMYHSSIEMDQHRPSSLIRASPVMPPSYYYFHPPHGSPATHSGQPPYIPSMSYYPISSYAAAVAALRNPLHWMHYQTGMLPGPPRLPFPYNGESGLGPPPPPGVSPMHLSSGPVTPWPSLNVQSSATDDPVSLVNVKDEHNADVPLNLSKH